MGGVTPRLSHVGPNTYTAVEAVKGGQIVEAFGAGVRPARPGSTVVKGVANIDAKPWVDPVSTDADGFEVVNVAPLPTETTAGFGRYMVTYSADCADGKALKVGATNGTVAPWASGVDAADLIIGYCDNPGGVTVATSPMGYANISR